MEDGLGNDSEVAYPEAVPGCTTWACSDAPDPGDIRVSREGLRGLLNLLGDCWPAVIGSYLKIHGKDPSAAGTYAEALTAEYLVDLSNRLSKVWCEGTLVVSGLFLHPETGAPVLNPCVEEDK